MFIIYSGISNWSNPSTIELVSSQFFTKWTNYSPAHYSTV